MSVLIADTAIKVGKLWTPYRCLQERLARYVRPCVLGDEVRSGYYSRTGSVTVLRYRSNFFGVTARHCLRQFDPEQLRIFREADPKISYPLKNLLEVTNPTDDEISDVLALVIDSEKASQPLDAFFDLETQPKNSQTQMLLAVGCVRREGDMAYDSMHIHVVKSVIPCHIDDRFTSNAKWLERCAVDRDKDGDNYSIDGMSGGAIFSLSGKLGSFVIYFRGMILRGNDKLIYFISADFIKKMLDHHFERSTEAF